MGGKEEKRDQPKTEIQPSTEVWGFLFPDSFIEAGKWSRSSFSVCLLPHRPNRRGVSPRGACYQKTMRRLDLAGAQLGGIPGYFLRFSLLPGPRPGEENGDAKRERGWATS